MKKIFLALVLFGCSVFGFGYSQEKQEIKPSDYTNQEVPMADTLREDGKIYVVVGIILVILSGMIVYLISVDRKINKLEREVNKTDQNQEG